MVGNLDDICSADAARQGTLCLCLNVACEQEPMGPVLNAEDQALLIDPAALARGLPSIEGVKEIGARVSRKPDGGEAAADGLPQCLVVLLARLWWTGSPEPLNRDGLEDGLEASRVVGVWVGEEDGIQ